MVVPGAGCLENSGQKVERNEALIESELSQFLNEAINLPSASTCPTPDKYDIGIDIYIIRLDLGRSMFSNIGNGIGDDLFLIALILIDLSDILIFARPRIVILCRSYFILNGNTIYQINIKETVSICENIKFLLKAWNLDDTQRMLQLVDRIKALFLKASVRALTAVKK